MWPRLCHVLSIRLPDTNPICKRKQVVCRRKARHARSLPAVSQVYVGCTDEYVCSTGESVQPIPDNRKFKNAFSKRKGAVKTFVILRHMPGHDLRPTVRAHALQLSLPSRNTRTSEAGAVSLPFRGSRRSAVLRQLADVRPVRRGNCVGLSPHTASANAEAGSGRHEGDTRIYVSLRLGSRWQTSTPSTIRREDSMSAWCRHITDDFLRTFNCSCSFLSASFASRCRSPNGNCETAAAAAASAAAAGMRPQLCASHIVSLLC
jgi:hypothetical protein